MIFHNSGCTINAESIGENFTCAQGVTVGLGRYSEKYKVSRPIIGDNVWICTNAVVFGGIKVGDNVTIGAGSVVLSDVPSNCTIAGNPAKIIRHL